VRSEIFSVKSSADSGQDGSSARCRGRRSRAFLEIENRIFAERRIRFYGLGVAVAYALSLVWRLVHGQWVILPDGRLRCVDFGWMWLSGRFAVSGNSPQIFDYSTFSAAQIALFGHDNCPFITPYVYPPIYLFMTYFLGFMPYFTAFGAWVLATLFLYGTAVYTIIPRRAAVIAAMCPFFVAVNADFGHNGFITAASVGFSLAFLERRPWLSGILLGLLSYKPHIGVLFPLALLASRNWRALASATVATVILGIGATLAFGSESWASFFHTLVDRQSTLSPDPAVPLALHSVFGLLRWLETSGPVPWGGQLIVAAMVALTVWIVWAKPIPFSLKAALLCIGSAIVSPYILFYDLCILTLAVAFLVRDGMSRGFLPGERTVILICFAALFLVQVPIGPVVCAALFFLALRRITVYRRLHQPVALGGSEFFETKSLVGDRSGGE
jgi:Glycosyltransferase family 87